MASKKLSVIITGDSKGMAKAVNETESKMSGLQSKLAGFGKKLAIGGAALGGGLLLGAKGAIDAARESQKISNQTDAVIKSMGNAANISASQVGDLATSISNATGIDDELIQSGENILLTFGNVRNELGKGNDIFNQTTQLAVDMSAALGTDVTSAASQLGKALNDPIQGVSKLTRSGVTFTDQQKAQIQALQESGDLLGAQKIILGEVGREFSGSAAAQGTAADKLKVTLGNLQEEIGAKLIPVVDAVAKWLADKLPGAFDKSKKFATDLLEKTEPLRRALADKVPKAIKATVNTAKELGEWLSEHKPVLIGITAAIGGGLVAAFAAWAVSAAAAAIATIAATLPIIAIGAAIGALVAGVIWAYQNWGWFRDAVDAVARFFTDTLWPILRSVAGWIVGTLVPTIAGIAAKFVEIATTIGEKVTAIVGFVIGIPGRIAATVSSLWNGLRDGITAARDWVSSMIDSIVSVVTGIGSRIGDVASAISSPFTSAFNSIKSLWNSTVGGFRFEVPSWIPGVGGKGFSIPEMHTGGVVPGGPAAEVLRVLQGGEVVLDRDTVNRLGRTPPAGTSGRGGLTVVNVTVPVTVEGSILTDEVMADRTLAEFRRRVRQAARPLVPGFA